MQKSILITTILTVLSAVVSAQTPVVPGTVTPSTLQLTVDEAVKMALDRNVDLAAVRIDPQISDARVAAAAGVFRPAFSTGVQRNNQLQPPSSFLIPTSTRNDTITSNVGVEQKLPWFGTSYSMSWTTAHTDSNSFLNSFNPIGYQPCGSRYRRDPFEGERGAHSRERQKRVLEPRVSDRERRGA
jgi:hypothetical protein